MAVSHSLFVHVPLIVTCPNCRGITHAGYHLGDVPEFCRTCEDRGTVVIELSALVWNVWTAITLAAAEKQGRRISNHHQKDVRRLVEKIEALLGAISATSALSAMVDQLEEERRRLNGRAEAFYESMRRERALRKAER